VQLIAIDWIIIASFFILSIIVGFWAAGRAGKSSVAFFLSGRNMPWYLLGFSMVATTFSTDTPNLVSDIVRQNGVSGNWVWWAFLLTGMLTVFVYAKLWRRSNVITDIEFYEIRYSGKPAAFLRGFRAIYLGLFFNITIMASVTLAAIKIGGIMLDLSPFQVILIAGSVIVIYSSLGGLLGVIITDFFLFIAAMIGSVLAAVYALNHPMVGGLSNLLSHPDVSDKLSLLPSFSNLEAAAIVFIIPLTIQWWSVWYPGAEPGGGGYVAQRMLAAKNEKHAIAATLFFNFAHYAVRPWPWIIVALCSIVVFPDLESIKNAFPDIDPRIVGHDMAYPAMLTYLPAGAIGLVFASLAAAYMSTMSTSLNLGSSYLVNDFYKRFLRPGASEKELVLIGRISTVLIMLLASSLALFMQSALYAFNILLQIGAGTGLLFLLRWFWYRINPFSEITAMVVSFVVAISFLLLSNYHDSQIQELVSIGYDRAVAIAEVRPFKTYEQLVIGVGITTISWLIVTFLTKPSDIRLLESFYRRVKPGGMGWKPVLHYAEEQGRAISAYDQKSDVPYGLIAMIFGSVAVYSVLFATGYWIYSDHGPAILFSVTGIVSSYLLLKVWKKMNPIL
jgi:solute:Na+ symporter, SSS family